MLLSIVKSKYVHFLFGMEKLGQDSRRRAHHLHRMFSEMRDAYFTYLNASKSGNSVCHQAEQDVVGK